MKIAHKLGFILAIFFAPLASCNSQPENFDYGRVEDGTYRNDYFGFTFKLPANWVVQSKEQTQDLANTGKKLLAGDDENMKAAIQASEIQHSLSADRLSA